jgi:hypothetical protein
MTEVTQMPTHHWQIGDVVPSVCFAEEGPFYEGKVLIVGRIPRNHTYRVQLADGTIAERHLDQFANRRYLAFKASRDPR